MWSQHWSDEQLLAHLYGIGPEDGHLRDCAKCRSRLETMAARGKSVAAIAETAHDVRADFLAAQRRAIYVRLEKESGWPRMRRWAPALATLVVAAGGVVIFEQQRRQTEISDAELVQQVSQMAEDATPKAVAPIEALFEQ